MSTTSDKQRFAGDDRYHLPARMIEPYRLWFEFVKLAHTDPDTGVDYGFYAEWGDFLDLDFDQWWECRWRSVFGVDAEVRVLPPGSQVIEDSGGIVVRLPLCRDPRETTKIVAELLQKHGAGGDLGQMRQGRYALSEGFERAFLKYLPHVRFLLRVYGIWLSHRASDRKGRIAITASEFYEWAEARDQLIISRKYRYTRPLIPFNVRRFGEAIRKGERPDPDDQRAFQRYLRKARNLAANAAQGVFPGRW